MFDTDLDCQQTCRTITHNAKVGPSSLNLNLLHANAVPTPLHFVSCSYASCSYSLCQSASRQAIISSCSACQSVPQATSSFRQKPRLQTMRVHEQGVFIDSEQLMMSAPLYPQQPAKKGWTRHRTGELIAMWGAFWGSICPPMGEPASAGSFKDLWGSGQPRFSGWLKARGKFRCSQNQLNLM